MSNAAVPEWIWFNGEVVPYREATMHVMSPAVRYGLSLLEGGRGYWYDKGEQLYVIQQADHYRRLAQNARVLRIPVPVSVDEYLSATRNVIVANGFKQDVHIRTCLTVGSPEPLGGDVGFAATEPIAMFIAPYAKGRLYSVSAGVKAGISTWERVSDRSQPPRLKTGANYLNARLAKHEAQRHGYDAAILLNRKGTVAEGPGEAVMIVRDGTLIAPSVTSDCLESVTKAALLELASSELKLPTLRREIDRTELYVADEIFLCGSGAEVVPVVSIDGLSVGDGVPGPITRSLQDTYGRYATGRLPAYANRLLEIW